MCESDELILDIYFMLERDGDERINDDLIILTKIRLILRRNKIMKNFQPF